MPNHITNFVRIKGTNKQIDEVLNFIKDENLGPGTIDFNKITPMPPWIFGFNPKVTGITIEDEKKYGGENTSIEWGWKHWGTKWNAYRQPDERSKYGTVYFTTAWAGVADLIEKIAWMFPDVIIDYAYADEDFGYNVGMYQFKDTQYRSFIPKNGSLNAYEMAMQITQTRPEEQYLRYNPAIHNYEYYGEDLYYYFLKGYSYNGTSLLSYYDNDGHIPLLSFSE